MVMRLCLVLLVPFLLVFRGLHAQSGHENTGTIPKLLRKVSSVDPAHNLYFQWATDSLAAGQIAVLMKQDEYHKLDTIAIEAAKSHPSRIPGVHLYYHEVFFSGLSENAEYYLRVGSKRAFSDTYPFYTTSSFIGHTPSVLPDRIMVTPGDNPVTSRKVTWRTDTTSKQSFLQWTYANDSLKLDYRTGERYFVQQRVVNAVKERHRNISGDQEWNYFSASVTDLEENKVMLYRVGSNNTWSEWFPVRTSSGSAPLKIIYLGDAQDNILSLWSGIVRRAFTVAPDVDIILHAGDLVDNPHADYQWDEWFQSVGFIHSMVPCVPVSGNHEYVAETPEGIAPQWRNFAVPTNGPANHSGSVYFHDFPFCKLIVLNSYAAINEEGSARKQAAWLDSILITNTKPWVIVSQHHPFYDTRGANYENISELILPVLNKHRVDLVLLGHDHTYFRGTMPNSGTVHVISTSGPKSGVLSRPLTPWMKSAAKISDGRQLYQIIQVLPGRLEYKSYSLDGEIVDQFILKKKKK